MNYTNNRQAISQLGTDFIYKVYAWMSAGLAVTAVTSYLFAHSKLALIFFQSPLLMIGCMLLQFGLVGILSFLTKKLSYTASAISFIAYSILTGISLSGLFFVYTYSSLASVFMICSSMFGLLSLYGYYTKADLSSLGSISMGALIGLILASLVNLYFRSSGLEYMLSIAGVLIFSALIMYDMQKIKNMSAYFIEEGAETNKIAILCGLTLYLDFINLFLYLLRILGKKNNRE